jgi:hypothetical protein
VITNELTESQRVAIQLSHNAITGKDDPNVLAGLYASLDFEDKLYSGLDDSVLQVDPLQLDSLSAGATEYQELMFSFLPEQAQEFCDLLERVGNSTSKVVHVAQLDDFDDLFNSMIRVKQHENIHNSALALKAMVQLANEYLDHIEALEAEGGDGGA